VSLLSLEGRLWWLGVVWGEFTVFGVVFGFLA